MKATTDVIKISSATILNPPYLQDTVGKESSNSKGQKLGKFPPCGRTAIELIRGCFLNKMMRLKHLRETTTEPENASEISTASADFKLLQ